MNTQSFNLDDELRSLGQEILGAGWKVKPEAEWTIDEYLAYHRWAKREEVRQIDGPVTFTIVEHGEHERRRREDVGEFLRPFVFTMHIGDGSGDDVLPVSERDGDV